MPKNTSGTLPIVVAVVSILVVSVAAAQAGPRSAGLKRTSVLSTGQVRCYDASGIRIDCSGTGQDGELQTGIAPQLVDNGDGTVTDKVSGLMWEKQSDDGSIHDHDKIYKWENVKIAALNAQGFAGHADWRLPNARELESIQTFRRRDDSIQPIFNTGCVPGCSIITCSCAGLDFHWSSTSYERDPTEAWAVGYKLGGIGSLFKKQMHYIRAVRTDRSVRPRSRPLKTGQRHCYDLDGPVAIRIECEGTGQDGEEREGTPRLFKENGDGTVTDEATGLMWEKLSADGSIHDAGAKYLWAAAFTQKVAALNAMAFAGHSDWRLPNRKELESLRSFSARKITTYAAFNEHCAAGCNVGNCSCTGSSVGFWSSSSAGRGRDQAWVVFLDSGITFNGPKSSTASVRAVRTVVAN